MFKKPALRPYWKRLWIVLLLSLALSFAFNELTYHLQRENYDRAPQTIRLEIPEGTASRVAAGEEVPSIPAELQFVIGDVLEVKNHDTTDHELGPLWIPAGGTARLALEQADKYALSCSFRPSRYLGFDVRAGTSVGVRLTGRGLTFPTTAILAFMYSLLVFPVKQEQQEEKASPAQEQR